MQEQVEKENAYSHSLSYQHSCENNNNRRRASLQQVADPLQTARNREKWRRRCSSSSQWEATCLPPLLSFPLSQPYWFIALVCLVFWQFTVMWRHLHALFMENLLSQGEKQKWNCGQSNLCILNTKFPKWLILSVLPLPPFCLFSLALSDYSIWQSACVKRANEYK